MKGWLGFRLAPYLTTLVLAGLLIGSVPVQAMTQPDTLRGVRFGDHGPFERAVIDLGSAVGPGASAPDFSWFYRDGGRVVRVKLPSVDVSRTAGGAGPGVGISRYYVVRETRPSGGMFVDFHLEGAAKSVKVFELDGPSRIVVDVTPGGKALYPKPVVGKSVVVMHPRGGGVGPALEVSGYGRPFEASGVWRIKNSDGAIVRHGIYMTSDWTQAWGAFRFTVRYPASFAGHSGSLEVGELSAANGAFRGVSVPVRFR